MLQDVGLGLVYGLLCGLLGSLLMPRDDREGSIPGHQRALYGLGLAFATYGLTVIPPHGNGFIAVFVAAIVTGIRRPDLREAFIAGNEEIVEIVKLGTFAVFGSLLTIHGLLEDGWAAVGVVAGTFLLARPFGIWVALAGTGVGRAAKAFIAWFGPKGVSTMAFSVSGPLAARRRRRTHRQHRRAHGPHLGARVRSLRTARHPLDQRAPRRGALARATVLRRLRPAARRRCGTGHRPRVDSRPVRREAWSAYPNRGRTR